MRELVGVVPGLLGLGLIWYACFRRTNYAFALGMYTILLALGVLGAGFAAAASADSLVAVFIVGTAPALLAAGIVGIIIEADMVIEGRDSGTYNWRQVERSKREPTKWQVEKLVSEHSKGVEIWISCGQYRKKCFEIDPTPKPGEPYNGNLTKLQEAFHEAEEQAAMMESLDVKGKSTALVTIR